MHTFKVAVYDVPGGKPRETRWAQMAILSQGSAKRWALSCVNFYLVSALQNSSTFLPGCVHTQMQSSTKRRAPGLMNFDPAVA